MSDRQAVGFFGWLTVAGMLAQILVGTMSPDELPVWAKPVLYWATIACVLMAVIALIKEAKWIRAARVWFLDFFWTGITNVEKPPSSNIQSAEASRAFTVEELERLASVMRPNSGSQTQKSSPFAKLELKGGTYDIIESHGVSSVSDHSVGDVEVNFTGAEALDARSFPQLISRDGSVKWKTLHHGATSTRIRILSEDSGADDEKTRDPPFFKIWKS